MRNKWIKSLILIIFSTFIISACQAFQETRLLDHATGDSDETKLAKSIYKARCISCHGNELQGKMGDASKLQGLGDRRTFDQVKKQIEDGTELMMPAYEDTLTQEEIDTLVHWLLEQK